MIFYITNISGLNLNFFNNKFELILKIDKNVNVSYVKNVLSNELNPS